MTFPSIADLRLGQKELFASDMKNLRIHAPHLMPPPRAPEPVRTQLPVKKRLVHEDPSILTKLKRMKIALKTWNASGRPITPRWLRKERDAACAVCPYFDSYGNFGFGQCRAPGCGCTRFKTRILTEKCPHPDGSRWPSVAAFTVAPKLTLSPDEPKESL